jgi:hypothetical protein
MNRLVRIGQRIRQRVGRRMLGVPPVPPSSKPALRIQQLERKVAEQEGRLDLCFIGSGLLVTGCLLVLHKEKKGLYG